MISSSRLGTYLGVLSEHKGPSPVFTCTYARNRPLCSEMSAFTPTVNTHWADALREAPLSAPAAAHFTSHLAY